MLALIRLALAYWIFLNALTAAGGIIGWFQLRNDRRRVSLYLSRILIAEAVRSSLAFFGVFYFADNVDDSPVFVLISAFSATLLTGAIWGWLFYLRGIWNGGGFREFITRIRRTPMIKDEDKERDDEKDPKPHPAPAPTTSTTGDGNDDDGNDRGGVTDGPGKTP